MDTLNGNSSAMTETDPLPIWLPPESSQSLGCSTPVDRWLINQSQYDWASQASRIELFWLLGRPSTGQQEASASAEARIVKADSTSLALAATVARPLVGAMLTMILAWLVIRNLIGWHRNLPTTDGQSDGRLVTVHGLPRSYRPYRRRWLDDVDWIDYDADDSDSLDANGLAAEDDQERLFIGNCHAAHPLARLAPIEPARCTVTYQDEEEIEDEDVSILCDMTSLSSDNGWTSSGGGCESVAVTGQEPPLDPILLIRSPLAACYLGGPDRNNNNSSSLSDSDQSDDSNLPVVFECDQTKVDDDDDSDDYVTGDEYDNDDYVTGDEEEDEDDNDFQSVTGDSRNGDEISFVSASSLMSTSFDDAESEIGSDFDTASSGSIANRVR